MGVIGISTQGFSKLKPIMVRTVVHIHELFGLKIKVVHNTHRSFAAKNLITR